MLTQVTGEANETQICEALRRYSEREGFVREALFHLFSLTHVMEKPRPDILKVNPFPFLRSHARRNSSSASADPSVLPAGGFGHEEPSCYAKRAAGGQRLRVQPDQAGPGGGNASTTAKHRHSAPPGGHEDLPQPPAGSQLARTKVEETAALLLL